MGKLILGVVVGFAVVFVAVMTATWAAMAAAGLELGDEPTVLYLALNLAGSLLAALLGGWIAVRLAGRRMAAAWVLVGAMVLLSAGSVVGEPAPGQPEWYPLAIALVGVVGVTAGGALAADRRHAGAVPAP
jgi:peptidoglycan/LPS O-acetylase OafA/YrhL